jgi:hypothetical protein
MSELEARTESRHLRDMVYSQRQKIAALTTERDRIWERLQIVEAQNAELREQLRADPDRTLTDR